MEPLIGYRLEGVLLFLPGACIIKLIKVVIYGFRNKLRVFVPGKPFLPSLVLRTNALAYYGNRKLRP